MMRVIKRILLWTLGIVGVLLVALIGSIVIEGWLGSRRVTALTNTEIANANGPTVRAYVARPSTPGPHPAVIMIHEWWGIRPEIVGKAEALAQQGYVVVAPDVMRGSSTGWFPRAIYQVVTTSDSQIDSDLDAVFAWLTSQPDVQDDRIAITGFCFGGGAALQYSLTNPNLAATAMFYGSTIADPQRLKALPGPLLGIFGGADQQIPVEEVRAFEAALDQAGVPNAISIYQGQPHAFVKSIEEIQQGGEQGRAWNELLTFLDLTLKGGSTAIDSAVADATTIEPAAFALPTPARLMHIFVCDRVVAPSAAESRRIVAQH